MPQHFIKDPEGVLDYAFDWTEWLEAAETIASYTIYANGVTIDSSPEAGGIITVWISGGVEGEQAEVICHVITSAGREDDRSIILQIENR